MWKNTRILVTGGASFIGSHLVDALIERGARIRVVDDLSSGSIDNLRRAFKSGAIEFIEADLREPGVARMVMQGMDIVFHLAADHGGRGYLETHPAGPASNFFLDGLIFWEALKAGVHKVVFASSGCVYPRRLQGDPHTEVYLKEELVRPPYDADSLYGWAKLMGELTLQAYHREYGLKAVSCRYFTVYGPRAKENHAIMAMIARAFLREDPFEIWGTGEQIRNWTYISDVVEGTLLAAEKIEDGMAINLGSMERVRVQDAAKLICELLDHRPQFVTRPDMPTGPLNRVGDNSLAKRLLGWEPKVSFREGIQRTVEWYVRTKNRETVRKILKSGGLLDRRSC